MHVAVFSGVALHNEIGDVMGALSPTHILIVVGVLVVLFGAKRLPDAARSLGRSARILKAEVKDMNGSDTTEHHNDPAPSIPAGSVATNADEPAAGLPATRTATPPATPAAPAPNTAVRHDRPVR